MDAISSYRLGARQKWQLAATLLLVYYPILLYVDWPVYIHGGVPVRALVVHEALNASVVLVIFFVWISISEWLLHLLFQRWGESLLLDFKLPAQIVLLLLATVLGLAFVFASGEMLAAMNWFIKMVAGTGLLIAFPNVESYAFWDLYRRANIGFFLLIMLSAFYLIANRRAGLRVKDIELYSERLLKENTRSQLEALRNQVNPHFLFNSLSILTSLVREDPPLAERFIGELSRFYRYSLDEGRQTSVALQVELEFVDAYIFLLKLRFGEKLRFRVEIPPSVATQKRIAPLTLQLLVENAVNHNQMSEKEPLEIDVTVSDAYVIVANTLKKRTQQIVSTQMGLRNIQERYALLTSAPVVIEAVNGKYVVKIPLLNE